MTPPLSPEERRRLETLFERGADLPAAEHDAFVQRECGANAELERELARLLGGVAGEDHLDRIAVPGGARAGTRIGPYELLEPIGEGGMGEVFAAEQREPLVRKVALKLIKPGMDSAQVVRRFEAERQALALMAHPHIAQVFDGGTTDDGRPYFVMEYVAGEPITEFCDRRKLSTRERLELFLAVCEGVQHAHQKGVVHRDLKPSNLLVTYSDGRAVPKIIDFGVARATSGQLGQHSLHTLLGQIVGTLDYMSPEQADPTGVDIDTRSDIYSLGVVLYQLVSGLLPFEHDTTGALPLSEVQRVIREQDPPTPSSRLRRSTDTATSIAPLHATDEHALVRQLEGDLDWICLKALEKDPARRYPSASELAADVLRHLAHQPVLARRPSALYRTRKFVRRNRVGVAAGLLVTAGVVAGLVGIVAGRIEANASARVAEVQQLNTDLNLLRRLELRADTELWPPHPEKIEALEAWVAEARELTSTLPAYRAELAALRARALPWTPRERERDRETHPEAVELRYDRARYDRLDWDRAQQLAELDLGADTDPQRIAELEQALVETEAQLTALEPELEALETEVAARQTWSFSAASDQSRHDTLTELVLSLEQLTDPETGLLGTGSDAVSPDHGWSVPRRLRFAAALEAGFAPGGTYAEAWEAAAPALREAYPGLELKPQRGLVPIGLDPDSQLFEFAHLMTGDPAERGADGRLVLTEDTGVVLVLVPAGSFWMGSQRTDPVGPNYLESANANELPAHRVELSAHFLSKYELTQGQWRRLTGQNPSEFGPDGKWRSRWLASGAPPTLLHPVEQVSWEDCMQWLPRAGLTLPSEAQWEQGCRAGTETAFWSGSDTASLQGVANVADRYGRNNGAMEWNGQEVLDDGSTRHAEVGSYRANAFGLHDVHGNVHEWVLDSFEPDFYSGRPAPDPVAPAPIDGLRPYRGGNFRVQPFLARSGQRWFYPPTMKAHGLGVRPARAVVD